MSELYEIEVTLQMLKEFTWLSANMVAQEQSTSKGLGNCDGRDMHAIMTSSKRYSRDRVIWVGAYSFIFEL